MTYDGPVLPLMLDVMRAAGLHDAPAVRSAADAALSVIAASPRHKARADILAAKDAAEAGEWHLCWGRAYQAISGLTHAFPPDPSRCPPAPGSQPHAAADCTGCGTDLPAGARFCHACGTGLSG